MKHQANQMTDRSSKLLNDDNRWSGLIDACEWFTTVNAIGKERWTECLIRDRALGSYEFMAALEGSSLPGTEYHYLIGSLAGKTRFVLPCYLYTAALESMAGSPIKCLVRAIRRFWPSFVQMRVLIVGTPLPSPLTFTLADDPASPSLLPLLEGALVDRARSLHANLIAFKEIHESERASQFSELSQNFLFVDGHPDSYISLVEGEPYENRLRSRYRNMLRRRKKALSEAGITWRRVPEYSHLADELFGLYWQVFERAQNKFEVLTPEFFVQMSKSVGSRSYILLAERLGQPVAFALMIRGDELLYPVFIGLDYSMRDEAALYYNLLYRIIDEGEEQGYRCLWFGPNAYESKALLGATFASTWLALRPMSRSVSYIVRWGRPVLFPETKLPTYRACREDSIPYFPTSSR